MVSMDAFASAFGFDAKSDDVWTTLGKVTAISGTTVTVLLGGSATPMECEAYCLPVVGDVVFVVISKGKARAIAVKGGGNFLKRKPSGTSELPQDTSTGSGFPIVLSDSFSNGGVISYMTSTNFVKLLAENGETTTESSNIITANTSNVTISGASYAQWGKLAMLQVNFTNKNAITVPASGDTTNLEVGTVASGKRPAIQCAAVCDGDGAHAYAYIGTGGSMKVGGFDSRGAQYTITAGTSFYMYATYVLA